MSTENEHDDERDEDGESGSPSSESGSDGDTSDAEVSVAADDGDGEAESDASEAGSSSSSEAGAAGVPSRPVKAASAASAGARLAAAKAAKAAKKAAKKQALRDEAGVAQQSELERAKVAEPQDAQEILTQSPLGRAATRAGEWAEANRQIAIGAAAIAAIAVFGWLGWSWWTGSQSAAAGLLLADAIEISSAEIVAPDAEEEAETEEPEASEPEQTFETLAARNEAALAAYQRVSAEYPSSTAATWAKLGEGRTLLAQGENEGARTAYEAAFHASGDDTVIAWQALEGIGASYEAEENWDEATATYERLAGIAEGAYANVASYHTARMHAASGDEGTALTSFRELVESLQEQSEDGEPPFPYVLAQADVRLRELDPSSGGSGPSPLTVPGGGEGGLEGLEGMDPEQLQELIRQLQTKSGGGGAH